MGMDWFGRTWGEVQNPLMLIPRIIRKSPVILFMLFISLLPPLKMRVQVLFHINITWTRKNALTFII
jgi:hypothetical protein